MLQPDAARPLDVQLVVVQGLSGAQCLLTGRSWLLGLLITNDGSGGPVQADVIDGGDVRGEMLGRLYVGPGAHTALNLPRPGWPLNTGLVVSTNNPLTVSALLGRLL